MFSDLVNVKIVLPKTEERKKQNESMRTFNITGKFKVHILKNTMELNEIETSNANPITIKIKDYEWGSDLMGMGKTKHNNKVFNVILNRLKGKRQYE
jgi:hypothetical protein